MVQAGQLIFFIDPFREGAKKDWDARLHGTFCAHSDISHRKYPLERILNDKAIHWESRLTRRFTIKKVGRHNTTARKTMLEVNF